MIPVKFLTQERAIEIKEECRKLAGCGPWSDQLSIVMSSGEKRQVKDIWCHESIPGNASFYGVFMAIVNGEIDARTFPKPPEPAPKINRLSWGEALALV